MPERNSDNAAGTGSRGRTFRHALYPEYKAGRDAQPEDLSAQLPVVRELVEAHHIPMLEVPEFEADDVIASLVARAPQDARVAIVSTDKDLMQLVSDRVTLLDGMKRADSLHEDLDLVGRRDGSLLGGCVEWPA